MGDLKPNKILISVCFLLVLIALPVSAGGSIDGESSGGAKGVAITHGSLSVSEGGWFSDDSATATTSTNVVGTVGVTVVVHYVTASGGPSSVDNFNSATGLSVSTSKSAPNDHGSTANGGHSYYEPNYGSWSGGTSLNFGS